MISMQDRGCICFPVHSTILSLNYLSLAHLETQLVAELSFRLEAHKFTFFSRPFIFISFLLLRKQKQSTSPSGQNLVPNFLIFYFSSPSTWFSSGSQSVPNNCVPQALPVPLFCRHDLHVCGPQDCLKDDCLCFKIQLSVPALRHLGRLFPESASSVIVHIYGSSVQGGVLPRFIPTTVWLVSHDCCLKVTMHWVAYNIFLRFQRQQL